MTMHPTAHPDIGSAKTIATGFEKTHDGQSTQTSATAIDGGGGGQLTS